MADRTESEWRKLGGRVFAAASLILVPIHQPTLSAQERYTDVMHGISDANYGIFDDYNPYATVEMLNHVRRERFDLILPRVMRDHGVDMWIHVIRPWSWGATGATSSSAAIS